MEAFSLQPPSFHPAGLHIHWNAWGIFGDKWQGIHVDSASLDPQDWARPRQEPELGSRDLLLHQ